jgi:hypothetical protein
MLALGAVPAAGAGSDGAKVAGAQPLDAARYRHLQAAAAARASTRTAASSHAPAGSRPVVITGFEGQQDDGVTPPDTTGALGPTRFVQLVNSKFGIFRRNGVLLSSVTFKEFMGKDTDLFDPQVIWDPDTRRFYFLMDDVVDNVDYRLAWGFSKTASPRGPEDWCKYSFGFGYGATAFPDYPKLGSTTDFLLFGSNVVRPIDGAYLGADVAWVSKPADGVTTCPAEASFRQGVERDLRDPRVKDPGLNRLFTPVPATQVDPARTGWVVSYPSAIYGPGGPTEGEGEGEGGGAELGTEALPAGSADILYVLKVTKAANGDARIGTPKRVRVPLYSFPPPAPQKGTPFTLDTLDARPTQAVAAKDPSKGGRTAVWTQHTVAGGAGTEVRWYELDPAARSVLRRGAVSDPSLWVFNGAISPDRAVNGRRRAYGSSMVVGFSTSSPDTYPAIQMVSKRARQLQSPFILIRQSAGPNVDFSCNVDVPCRWGDYSGATPDPASPSGRAVGRVGLTNQWNLPGPDASLGPVWRTWIWVARPCPRRSRCVPDPD